MHLKTDQIFSRLLEYLWMPVPASVLLSNHVLRLILKLIHLNPVLAKQFYSSHEQLEKLLEQGCFEREDNENELFIMNFT